MNTNLLNTNRTAFFQLVGFLHGDGVVNLDTNTIRITTSKTDTIIRNVQELLKIEEIDVKFTKAYLSKNDHSSTGYSNKSCYYTATFESDEICQFLREINFSESKYSENGIGLRNLDWLIDDKFSNNDMIATLNGFWIADGSYYYNHNNSIRIGFSTSATMAVSIKNLLESRFDIESTITVKKKLMVQHVTLFVKMKHCNKLLCKMLDSAFDYSLDNAEKTIPEKFTEIVTARINGKIKSLNTENNQKFKKVYNKMKMVLVIQDLIKQLNEKQVA